MRTRKSDTIVTFSSISPLPQKLLISLQTHIIIKSYKLLHNALLYLIPFECVLNSPQLELSPTYIHDCDE